MTIIFSGATVEKKGSLANRMSCIGISNHAGAIKMKDILGNRYGKLVVREFHSRRGYKYYYMCDCDCGGEKKVLRNHLISRGTQSCGCLRKMSRFPPRTRPSLKKITGKRVGRLVVRERLPGKDIRYICDCDCGGEIEVPRGVLLSKNTRSCGCLRRENMRRVRTLRKKI